MYSNLVRRKEDPLDPNMASVMHLPMIENVQNLQQMITSNWDIQMMKMLKQGK